MGTTARPVVSKTIGGITFDDAYDWLKWDTPEALAWQWASDDRARAFARSRPAYAALAALGGAENRRAMPSQRRLRNGRFFHLGDFEGRNAIFLAADVEAPARVVIDARAFDDGSGRAEFVAFEPSADGAHIALSVTWNGAMVGRLAIIDVARGTVADATVERKMYLASTPVWTLAGDACYWADRDGAGNHLVYQTALGGETRELARFDERVVPRRYPGLQMHLSPEGRQLIGSTVPHDRRAAVIGDVQTGAWRPFLAADIGGECNGAWSDAQTFIAIVTHGAERGRIVAIPVATSSNPTTWRRLVAESAANLRALTIGADRIVVCAMVDASVRYFVYRMDGKADGEIPLPPCAFSPDAFVPRYIAPSDGLVVSFGSFTQSLSQYRYDPDARTLDRIAAAPDRIDGIEVEQRFVSSSGGAKPTYFQVGKAQGAPSGPRPTLIMAYGGFNVAWMPKFVGGLQPFLNAGGVLVHAVLRGGGEYGQGWYDDGRLANKQHTYDDLYAIADDLIARGVTCPDRLAFKGDSNGGLTGGVAVVQRPDLWRIVVCGKPIFDMLEPMPDEPRFAAVASFFRHDFGDPDDPASAAVLAAYSPLHNVRAGVACPAVFAFFGEHDLGSLPYHGRRFIAALRDADPGGRPHELRVWRGVGHGARDARDVANQEAEWLAVVMAELGLPA